MESGVLQKQSHQTAKQRLSTRRRCWDLNSGAPVYMTDAFTG